MLEVHRIGGWWDIHVNFLGIKVEISSLKKTIKERFAKTDEALEDHLLSINENTNEIQTNYEYLCEMDSKMDKLSQRLDEMQMLLQEKHESALIPLNRMEQKAFLALYTHDVLTFSELSMQIGLTEPIMKRVVAHLIRKGVPVKRELKGNSPALMLDPDFKDLQAKEQVVELDPAIVAKC